MLSNEEFCHKLLAALPSQTLELKRKKFHNLSFGPDNYIWIVTDGLVMTVRSAEDGRFKGNGLYGANTILGLSGFYGVNKDVTCFTLSKTTLRYVPTKLVIKLLQSDVELCYAAMVYSCQLFGRVMDELEVATLLSLEEQITSFEKTLGQMDLPDDLSVTETCIAIAIGAHPVSVSRARKRLKDQQGDGGAEE